MGNLWDMEREKDRENFVRLAESRVKRVIKDIRLIGNLSNRSNYFYTDADVRRIITRLKEEVRDLESRFQKSGSNSDIDFKLG
jgi:hypothetical protein